MHVFDSTRLSEGQVICPLAKDAAIVSRASQILEAAAPAAGYAHRIIEEHTHDRPLLDRPLDTQTSSSTIGGGQVNPSVRRACLEGCSSTQFVPETPPTHSCCPYSEVGRDGHHLATVTATPEIDAADALPLLALAEAVGATAVIDGCLNLIATAEEAVVDAARKTLGDALGVIDWARAVGRLARWPRNTTRTPSSPQRSTVLPPTKPRSTVRGRGDSCRCLRASCHEDEGCKHCHRGIVGGVLQRRADDGGPRAGEIGGEATSVGGCNGANSGYGAFRSGRIDRAFSSGRRGFRPANVDTNGEMIGNTPHKTDKFWAIQPVDDDTTTGNKGDDGGIMTGCSERTQALRHESDENPMTTDGVQPRASVRPPPLPPPPSATPPHKRRSGVICHDSRNVVGSDDKLGNMRARAAAWQETGSTERTDLDHARDEKAYDQRWCRWATPSTSPGVSVKHRGARAYCGADAVAAEGKQASESDGDSGDRCENGLDGPISLSSVRGRQGAARRVAFASIPTAGARGDGHRCSDYTDNRSNCCPPVPAGSSLKPPENSFSHAFPSRHAIGKATPEDVASTGAASARRRFLEIGGKRDDNVTGEQFHGGPKLWPPDKAVAAMLVVREDQRLCAQARKRALQRLRQTRRQQEVERAEACADERKFRVERCRRREQKVTKILAGRRRGGADAAKSLGGCWSEGEQYFGDRRSIGEFMSDCPKSFCAYC